MQKRNTQLTMKDIDASMVFGILVGVAAIIIAFPFLIVWALINDSSGSTGRSSTRPVEDSQTQAEIDGRAAMEGWLSPDPKVASSLNEAEYFEDDDSQWR